MKLAIVHEWLTVFGGSETCVKAFAEIFDRSEIFCSIYDEQSLGEYFKGFKIHESFLSSWPKAKSKHQHFLPLMPLAYSRLNVSDFDVVLSSSHCCAKGVPVSKKQLHLCYCYTPMRYAWEMYPFYRSHMGALTGTVFSMVIPFMRRWDLKSAKNVDRFIAISHVVADRIRRHYGVESDVIYPPVDVDYFSGAEKREEDYLIYLGRLVPYKRPELALLAARELNLPIKFVGDGPELENLKAIGYDKAEFLGFLPREQLRDVLSGARALIFPPEEDFGITPLEGTAAGVPVAAYGVGGATETVVEGLTGSLFMEHTPASAAEAVKRALEISVDRGRFTAHAEKFSTTRFKREFVEYVGAAWEKFKG